MKLFNLQPSLKNDIIGIRPLQESDLEALYKVASDPLTWAQHPNKERYKRNVFEEFFREAIKSEGAFLIFDSKTKETIGSTRFYELDAKNNSVAIGYTFLARDRWGTTCNWTLKTLMLDHAFKSVDTVIFHVGEENMRSRKAVEKLGAKKIGERLITYAGETQSHLNLIYALNRKTWATLR